MAANNNKDLITQYFKRGASVEISSDDDGFRGAWYTGKVIRKLRKDKLLVEYETLMEDEDGKRRLREELDVVQLRPPAPRDSCSRGYKLNEEVDAYYNDGWWEGVITEVLGKGEYAVFFRATREQIQFGPSDLRLHREWMDGKWVPPLETEPKDEKMTIPTEVKPVKEIVQQNCNKGALVEVSSDEEGFAGAWFAATVIEQLDKDKYLIQYQSLRNEDDTEFLREEVDSLHIRPYPPDTAFVDCFKVLEEVDALFNDGWWVGVISEVLEGKKYNVYFRGSNEELEFKHSDLRHHQDWIDGKWVIPSQNLNF